jgi:hypothetical protein
VGEMEWANSWSACDFSVGEGQLNGREIPDRRSDILVLAMIDAWLIIHQCQNKTADNLGPPRCDSKFEGRRRLGDKARNRRQSDLDLLYDLYFILHPDLLMTLLCTCVM